ncbi:MULTISPECIES: molybdenum cofactor guanylyltransferase [unclassified Pseudoalteromonas]|uniref:molybdenum cofactor guanylyltransferase n=2 Tax=Pseudoalteromonas TaxID=53246 RepID=UPI000C32F1D7|nr:molybdenum cofactor guanylyltransferase [Pseudoalteromonas sp. 78C3]PKH92944.1 molybdenum cofactor guanylyltransferase [Pseudoalteromonas sp. 78C3]
MGADVNTHIKANMKVKRDFTGVVLAGGKSSRMGTDKADLVLKNKTLLHNACDLLKDAGAKNILVSRNVTNPIKSLNHYPSEKYVKDIYPNSGPLGGIYSTLIATEHDLLITAVDMPLLTSSLLSTIVLASQTNNVQSVSNQLNQSQIHAWHFENEPLPLYIRNTHSVKNHLKHILTNANSHKSIKQFTQSIGVQTLLCNKAHALINTNTPAQFKAVNEHFDQSINQLRRTL